jgi:hypothetical protein
MSMSKTLLAALAAVALLSAGMLGTHAAAMTLAPPQAFGVASVRGTLVERVTNVCGMNGCAPVQTKRIVRPKQFGSLVSTPIIVQPGSSLRQSLGLIR